MAPLNVHFVGSLPRFPTSDVAATFARIANALPPGSLKRLPDGEPDVRHYFTGWQKDVFDNAGVGHVTMDSWNPDGWRDWSAEEVERTMANFPKLETGYDTEALKSYEIFVEQRKAGRVADEIKFQVCLPTSTNFVGFRIQPDLQAAVEPHYEAALLRASRNVQAAVPHSDLAIQIDLALEFAYLHDKMFKHILAPAKYLPVGNKDKVMAEVMKRILRLAESVDEDVELGFHFCYGDAGKQHFFQPPDTSMIVEVALNILASLKRPITWFHLPVPKDRTDEAYLLPLKTRLLPKMSPQTELYLGLVHENDMDGTEARFATAKRILGSRHFGISTECGLGRREEKDLKEVLEVERAMCEAVSA